MYSTNDLPDAVIQHISYIILWVKDLLKHVISKSVSWDLSKENLTMGGFLYILLRYAYLIILQCH